MFRGATASFAGASALGPALPQTAQWFNDYTASPLTTYFYWLQDQNSNLYGPQEAATLAAFLYQEAINEAQMNALVTWAYGVWQGLYTTYWRYLQAPQPYSPKIVLNCTTAGGKGGTDWLDPNGEALIGSRVATISVLVSTNPIPAIRYLASNSAGSETPPAGTYSVTLSLNGNAGPNVPYSVTFATAPASGTAVVEALVAIMQDNSSASPPVITGLNAWLVGTDPQNQQIAIEAVDPSAPLSVVGTIGMTAAVLVPPKAMTIAQRLWASLGDDTVLDALSAAGIGVGNRNPVQDVSAMLDTSAELIASFDFYANVAEIYPITPGLIDTVGQPTGTFVN